MFFQYFLKKVARQQIIKRIFLKKEAENAAFQERQKNPAPEKNQVRANKIFSWTRQRPEDRCRAGNTFP